MGEIRFDDDDILELRRRLARPQRPSAQVSRDSDFANSDGGLVQLNVRIRAELKRRIELMARERHTGFAEVIEMAIDQLERATP